MMVLSLELLGQCNHYVLDFSKKNRVLLHQEVNKKLISVNLEHLPMQDFVNGFLRILVRSAFGNPDGQDAEQFQLGWDIEQLFEFGFVGCDIAFHPAAAVSKRCNCQEHIFHRGCGIFGYKIRFAGVHDHGNDCAGVGDPFISPAQMLDRIDACDGDKVPGLNVITRRRHSSGIDNF